MQFFNMEMLNTGLTVANFVVAQLTSYIANPLGYSIMTNISRTKLLIEPFMGETFK